MTKFNFKFIAKTMGFLLIIESLFIIISAIVSFYYQEIAGDSLLLSATITVGAGLMLRIVGSETRENPIGLRESYSVVTLTWIVLSFFGMLPFYLSGAIPNITDAYFETMSGFTTTGASILSNIEEIPKGLLFWRSLTQWIGGLGIVVFALAILPMIGGNASVLFDAESSGITQERFQPRVAKVAKRLWIIYVFFTSVLCFLLWLGPMSFFDAACHALTTISTGGYSTKQAGLFFWQSPYLDYVIIVFMFIGGINFSLFYYLFHGNFKKLFKNEEFRWYSLLIVSIVLIVTTYLIVTERFTNIENAFRYALFQIVSTSTSTGFTVPDYALWGAFYLFLMCFSMFFCACVGSTSGGAKIVRLVVVAKTIMNELKRQVHPNAIFPIRLNGDVISREIVNKIVVFFLFYLIILVFSFVILSFFGMSFEEAVGNSISCMGNVGPGLGTQALDGHFANVNSISKWYLSFLMLVGRLEVFTVLSLFIPAFWKK